MPNRIHPLSPSSVNSGRVHAPGTGHAQGPRGPQGPTPTHPKTLERIGPLAGLMGRSTRPAKEGDARPRTELPRSRDTGSRSWMSSMKHAASKTGHAISHGFNRAGHALHKFGQSLNEPNHEPSWMSHMSDDERAHYDYYGELPAESSHSSYSSQSSYVAAPWEKPAPSSYVAAPWEQPKPQPQPSSPSHQTERAEVRHRPMTSAEQAAANEEARYYGVEPRTTIDEFVPSRPASPPRAARTNRDALLANIRETVPRMNLNRLNFAEPRDFVRLALNLTKGTAYEQGMNRLAHGDPALGDSMKERWVALRQHLDGLRAQGNENVPRLEWLFENRPSRMMAFLVEGRDGGKLVRPTTRR